MNLTKKIKEKIFWLRNQKTMSTINDYRQIEGWLTENEALGLYKIAELVNSAATVVEIGSWKGKSTYCLARGLRSGKIFAIDPFNGYGETGSKETYEKMKGEEPLFNQFISTLKTYQVSDRVEPLMGYSSQFITRFTEIDLLFIDGDHSIQGCDFDFMNYSPMVKKAGFIAFHDFDPKRDDLGPTWVIKNRIMNNPRYSFYRRFDSLWVARKID